MVAAKTSGCTSPLSREEFSLLMQTCAPFEANPHIAVAFSGGGDSMALALLALGWAKERGGTLTLLTVDHGLRTNSAAEAEALSRWAHAQGIAHTILRWQPPVGRSRIQERARIARYQLLDTWCREHSTLHLLTAHHSGDQCETLFFRLARHSGLEGLACMPTQATLSYARLLRPLLQVPKARLIATVNSMNTCWLEDPSNHSDAYTRNRIRAQLSQLPNYSLLEAQCVSLSARLGYARKLLFNRTVESLTSCLHLHAEGYATLEATWLEWPEDLQIRSLEWLTATYNGGQLTRRHQMRRLLISLRHGQKSTSAGLVFRPRPNQRDVEITREISACESIVLARGQRLHWDSRFSVEFSGSLPSLTVAALGPGGLVQLGEQARIWRKRHSAAALQGLPALWHLDELVCVPHMQYYTSHECTAARAEPCSAKPLAEHPFFGLNVELTANQGALENRA